MKTAFESEIEKQSLCATVGRVMFCPKCEELMDFRRAVEFSVWEIKSGKCAAVRAMCAPCWDSVHDFVMKPCVKYRVDVIDGRGFR